MAKLSRARTKLHDEAMELINSDRPLNGDEIELCYKQYSPMAEHNIGKGGIFFTPPELAWNFYVMSAPKGRVIDLCAGIGVLSWALLLGEMNYLATDSPLRGDVTELVCIEQNQHFVDIGRRLLPQATWICGSVFDKELVTSLGEFDSAISNPPYGNIPSKKEGSWLKVKGPAQWMVVELTLRLAYNGGCFILLREDSDYDYRSRPLNPASPVPSYVRGYGLKDESNKKKYLEKHFPGVHMMPESIDTEMFIDQWEGAKPDVLIVDVCPEDVSWKRPYGFDDVLVEQLELL